MRIRIAKQIRRSQAAIILGNLTPRTCRRYEVLGLLTPIKRNERLTLYDEDEVLALAAGKVAAPCVATKDNPAPRGNKGQFARKVGER